MNILMVCMGNICRSPMAEGIMRALINKKNLLAKVDSAGTIGYHEGAPPDKRAQQKMREYGLDISHLRARPFEKEDFDKFDMIYVMDADNYKEVMKKARNENEKKKVKMILNEAYPNQNLEVPDPYYGGEQGFENVYQLLSKACSIIAERIAQP